MPWMMQPTSTKRACNLLCYKVITSTIHLNCIRWIHWIRPGSAGLCWVRWVRHFFLIVGAGYLPTCLLASLDRTATMASGGFLSSFFSLSLSFSRFFPSIVLPLDGCEIEEWLRDFFFRDPLSAPFHADDWSLMEMMKNSPNWRHLAHRFSLKHFYLVFHSICNQWAAT